MASKWTRIAPTDGDDASAVQRTTLPIKTLQSVQWLQIDYEIDRQSIMAHLQSFITERPDVSSQPPPEYSVIVQLDKDLDLSIALAALLYAKPDTSTTIEGSAICRKEWLSVAASLPAALAKYHGKLFNSNTALEGLVAILLFEGPTAIGSRLDYTASVASGPQGHFKDNLYWVCYQVIKAARERREIKLARGRAGRELGRAEGELGQADE